MLKKTGTLLHQSAADHARQLAAALDGYEVDEAAMKAFLPPQRRTSPSNVVHEDLRPTQVLEMNLDDGLVDNLRRELILRSKISEAISDMSTGAYFPLSTQFENSILFLPSAQRFYNLNKDLIASTFPELYTAVVNAFVVPPNKRPYGTHNAGSIGFQIPVLAQRALAYPQKHMSFHTAVTATPLDRQPLVIFEDALVESPNTSYLYDAIKSYDLDPDEAYVVDKAFFLHDSGGLSEIHLPTVRDFLLSKFWEKKYATMPERASGYYFDCKPGQALFFNNYRPHGDSTMAPSPESRVTIDVRCFSKVKYRSEDMKGGIDLIMSPAERERKRARKRATLECLLLTLGYEDVGQFMRSIYGDDTIDPFDIMTDLQFSVYNKTEHYILEQNLEPHYERVGRVYDQIERDGDFVLPQKAEEAIQRLYSG